MADIGSQQQSGTGTFAVRAWVWANVAGLALAYGLFALLGDAVELVLGVAHDSPLRDLALLAAFLTGAGVFVVLRRRALAPHTPNSTWTALVAGIGLSAGFVVGFIVAGPPFDFMLGVIALGTIGGGLQWRALRDRVWRPGGLLLASIGGWVLAGVAVAVAAFSVEPVAELLGLPLDASMTGTLMGTVSFVVILTVLGVVGGTVGGLIEGRALSRRFGSDAAQSGGAL